MIITYHKSAVNGLILCDVLETTGGGGVKLRLLEDKGVFKSGYVICTLPEFVVYVDTSIISRIAKKVGFTGKVTKENAREIVQSLAENYIELFSKSLERIYKRAVDQYTGDEYSNNVWDELTSKADSILALLDIDTDYPGLYPTFELERNGKHFTEYSTLGALRQYNNHWNHW